MQLTPFALAAALLASPAAYASGDKCHVPQDKWRPVAELTDSLTAKGWTIANVKTDDGCYEVYAKDEHGKRVEAFFDPATFALVGYDD